MYASFVFKTEMYLWRLPQLCWHGVIFFFRRNYCFSKLFIIRCIFSFLFISRELTTWPANNCLQISILLQIIFCSCVIETTLLCRNWRFPEQAESDLTYWVDQKNGDRMTKQQSLNSVIAKYRDSSVSRRSIICLSLRPRQIVDLLATDKSRYFAQPRSIIN